LTARDALLSVRLRRWQLRSRGTPTTSLPTPSPRGARHHTTDDARLPALGIALPAAVKMSNFAEAQQPKRGGVLNIADPAGPPVLAAGPLPAVSLGSGTLGEGYLALVDHVA
jgi:hypothetical protein